MSEINTNDDGFLDANAVSPKTPAVDRAFAVRAFFARMAKKLEAPDLTNEFDIAALFSALSLQSFEFALHNKPELESA